MGAKHIFDIDFYSVHVEAYSTYSIDDSSLPFRARSSSIDMLFLCLSSVLGSLVVWPRFERIHAFIVNPSPILFQPRLEEKFDTALESSSISSTFLGFPLFELFFLQLRKFCILYFFSSVRYLQKEPTPTHSFFFLVKELLSNFPCSSRWFLASTSFSFDITYFLRFP